MKIIGVIPARYNSTRFKGKVLAQIAGKPMIQHVWERVSKSKLLNDVIIACDDEKIISVAKSFKANAVMTSKYHESGTDRIAEVVKKLDVDIVINIQGDEPLIDPSVIDNLAIAIKNDEHCLMATLVKVIEDKEEISNSNVVKVVLDDKNNALFFSRAAIPYNRENQEVTYLKHLGVYAYRKDFLLMFKSLPKSNLEKIEKLEQLRVLEAGYKIKAVMTDLNTIGVDTKEDLLKVEKIINA